MLQPRRLSRMQIAGLRRRRATAQLLHRPPGRSITAVVGALLAVQAQDLTSARLALRARIAGLASEDIDRALSERALVVTWLNRGTLHLVRAEDYPWLLRLTATIRAATNRRRLSEEGVRREDADRAVVIIEQALARDGPLLRHELAERIAAHGIRTEGQAMPHLLLRTALSGSVVLGPMRGQRQAFVLTRDWLACDDSRLSPRPEALAELARRYLAGHAPAADTDLARWSGLSLGDVRAGLRSIRSELVEVGDGLVDLAGRDPTRAEVEPRLLPAYDPYLLGWRDRRLVVPAGHARAVHPGGGTLRAIATARGEAVGTWTARRSAGHLAVYVEPFGSLSRQLSAALETDAADVARFEGRQLR